MQCSIEVQTALNALLNIFFSNASSSARFRKHHYASAFKYIQALSDALDKARRRLPIPR